MGFHFPGYFRTLVQEKITAGFGSIRHLVDTFNQFVNILAQQGQVSPGIEFIPNVMTDYLFELAKTFSRFYDRKLGVRVIDASPASVRMSRLRLCDLTARTLKLGLNLLGISTLEQM